MARTVLVTGATGFIGRHVLDGLDGCILAAAVRDRAAARPGVRTVVVDPIGSRTDWHGVLDEFDAVVHLAGLAHRSRRSQAADAALYDEVNARGTLRLAEAAARAGVRDFVFMSSIHVNGSSSDGHAPFRETDAPRPVGPYAASKARAETGLAAIADRTAMAVTIVRPPVVHGPGAGGNVARLAGAVRRGLPLPLAAIRNRRAFLGVRNLVAFIAWRLGRDNRGAETFILADPEQVSTPDFVARLATAFGRSPRLFPVPAGLLRAALGAAGRAAMAEGLLASLEVDAGKAAAAGWRPPEGLDDGLRALAAQMTEA